MLDTFTQKRNSLRQSRRNYDVILMNGSNITIMSVLHDNMILNLTKLNIYIRIRLKSHLEYKEAGSRLVLQNK